jgi:hypothetical protein
MVLRAFSRAMRKLTCNAHHKDVDRRGAMVTLYPSRWFKWTTFFAG